MSGAGQGRSAVLRMVLPLLWWTAACGLSPSRRAPEIGRYVRDARTALLRGDLALAERILDAGRRRYPHNGAIRLWSAKCATMRQANELALIDLQAALASEDRGGFTVAEVNGEIGDLLFRLGRYQESVRYLKAGEVGTLGTTRKVWAELAASLPAVRLRPDLAIAELPLVEGRLPELICSIGGKQRPFVLDTGATFSTLSNSLAAELGVSPVLAAGEGTDGLGRRFPISVGVLSAFSLGEVEIGPQPVLVVENGRLALRYRGRGPEHRHGALVGLDVLGRFRVTLDPSRSSVVFQNRRGLAERGSEECLWVEGRLLVPVEVEDQRLWFALDTGASDSSLTEAGLQALSGGSRRVHETYRPIQSPGGGQVSVREVRGLDLRISEVRFRGVDLPVVERQPPETFPLHGVLGADLLLRCRVTLDGSRVRVEGL